MGVPWITTPVMLHSSRADTCKLTPEQCAFRNQHWLYWYQDDHTYALPTVYFFIVAIVLFSIGNIVARSRRHDNGPQGSPASRVVSIFRFCSYRGFQIARLGWLSPSLGVILLGLAGVVYFFGMTLGPQPYYWPNTMTLSYGSSPPIATRSGFLALACLPFEMILATKANMISALTGVPHEKLQVFHRWVGWAMFVLALVHTFPFIIYHIKMGDMVDKWKTDSSYWTGIIALIAQAWLTIMSIGPIRNRFYEFFKSTHYIAIIVFVVFFFLHCDFRLSSWDYFIATGVLYTLSLLYSQLRTYFEYGFSMHARLDLINDNMLKVSVPVKFTWTPGQHVFIRFQGIGIHSLTTHPFTICSLPLPSDSKGFTQLVLYVKPGGGVTRHLATLARNQPGTTLNVLIDGPYGGLNSKTLATFNSGLIVAGGSGAGLTLPLIEDWLLRKELEQEGQGLDEKSVGEFTSSSLRVILATRHQDVLAWYNDEISKLRALAPEALFRSVQIDTYCTSVAAGSFPMGEAASPALPAQNDEKNEATTHSTPPKSLASSEDVLKSTALVRPNLPHIVHEVTTSPGTSSVGIVVCGPGSMLHDVRNAAAEAQVRILKGESGAKEVYMHSEPFSW